jgi:NAD(P)H-flavin reductase
MNTSPISLSAHIAGPVRWIAGAPCLPLILPEGSAVLEGPVAGRYFLARCAEEVDRERTDWSLYLRRPLYAVQQRAPVQLPGDEWLLHLPPDEDPGHAWLGRRAEGGTVDLLGPFGNGFALPEAGRNLLLLADLTDNPGWLALLLALLEPMLDRGGRVTLLLRLDGSLDEAALSHLPIAVEVHTAPDEAAWARALITAIPWADQICAGVGRGRYSSLAQAIQAKRFRLEEGFCQILVQADILCGVGACLACVIPTSNGGITRACTHGPVFDLTRLAQ